MTKEKLGPAQEILVLIAYTLIQYLNTHLQPSVGAKFENIGLGLHPCLLCMSSQGIGEMLNELMSRLICAFAATKVSMNGWNKHISLLQN